MKLPIYHVVVFFLGGLGILVVSELIVAVPIFWMLLIWGLVLSVHSMYSLSLGVDDSWAAKRADELVDNAYDVDHIENIRKRRTAQKK